MLGTMNRLRSEIRSFCQFEEEESKTGRGAEIVTFSSRYEVFCMQKIVDSQEVPRSNFPFLPAAVGPQVY